MQYLHCFFGASALPGQGRYYKLEGCASSHLCTASYSPLAPHTEFFIPPASTPFAPALHWPREYAKPEKVVSVKVGLKVKNFTKETICVKLCIFR